MTAAVTVMVLVAMTYANDFLGKRMAENEYTTNRQFMYTTGLQIDDMAWTVGRAQTVRYSSQYGNMKFESLVLNYTFEVFPTGGSGEDDWTTLFSIKTGMILFNMPVEAYSIGNNYFERVLPTYDGSFLQNGSSAPVSHVFCVEKLPMNDGSYIRIGIIPSIRMLNSTISGPTGSSTNYTKLYLPVLEPGNHGYLSQSITMTGNDIIKMVSSGVDRVRITATFPNAASGFDNGFFNFEDVSKTVTLSEDSVVELYVGKVIVTLGQV
jgi:hypothetical protein